MAVGAEDCRLPAPCSDRERGEAAGKVGAEKRAKFVGDEGDGGILARGLELAGEDAAEEALDDRAAEGPQVVAAGANTVEVAEKVALRRDRVRLGERKEDLVGEAERQA